MGRSSERAEQSVEDGSQQAGAEARRERLPPPCHRVADPQAAGVLEGLSGERALVDRDHLGGESPVADLHDVKGSHTGQALDLHQGTVHADDVATCAEPLADGSAHAQSPCEHVTERLQLEFDEDRCAQVEHDTVAHGDDAGTAPVGLAYLGLVSQARPGHVAKARHEVGCGRGALLIRELLQRALAHRLVEGTLCLEHGVASLPPRVG